MAFWNPYPPLLWSSENRIRNCRCQWGRSFKSIQPMRFANPSHWWAFVIGMREIGWGTNHSPVPPVKWRGGYNHPEKIGRRWKRLCRYGRSGEVERWKVAFGKIGKCVVMMLRSSVSVEEVSLVYRRMCLRGHPSRGGSPKDYLKLQAVGNGHQRQLLEKATLTSFVGVSHLIFVVIQIYAEILMIWQLPPFLKDHCDTFTRFF